MFDHFAYSVLAVPVLVLCGTWVLTDRLQPVVAARIFAWSAVTAGASSAVNVFVFMLKAVTELPSVAAFGGWSHEIVKADTAHVPWVSLASVIWAVLSGIAIAFGYRRYRASLRNAWAQVDDLGDTGEVVVLPDARIEAFALPGRPGEDGRVVVTEGLRGALSDREYAAVLAHERAHLSGDHHRLVWMTRLSAYAQPALWPLIRRVGYMVERAADEEAARVTGDRGDVAKAIARAALARKDMGTANTAGMLAMSAPSGAVPRRMAAMMGPAVARRWLLAAPVLIAVSTVIWTGECVYDLFELLIHASV
ncbi:M56 family metallopeptidase [Actinocorallia sp. API 0066]|uniref:M56 family metallopeptidase n=1 Tax=Actinocorallia sp. API 0066 TaxID=2896846 RepID=UPI001E29A81E|nr:M56 family metallopeptidase [Actinocorallia sp. API 0066]MCD0449780.1 M56 family metallopeptidase [Actinocorallia sp. API 0066]